MTKARQFILFRIRAGLPPYMMEFCVMPGEVRGEIDKWVKEGRLQRGDMVCTVVIKDKPDKNMPLEVYPVAQSFLISD